MSLYCLVYTSVAKQKMTDNCLKNLLDRTRSKNSAVSLTGMLLYIDPYFVQILEGDFDDVCETFTRISKDPIHHKVSLILKKPITERNFANLAMGFNKVTEKHIDSFVSLEAFYKSESFKKQSKDIIELLEMFKNETLF